ncbi:hypothetical protein KIY80_gp03 [Mycobacterium phage Benvolio]|uniref:VIP2-like toxin n=1 Tax=Mycobacterium phage Benvolio TaxID=2591074 RepID=A0A514A3I5_9CAUD|nr:hypothetical protein KIY80_gp03 [Mycobacterium phage Benvolio]QDH47821.1 VIP2-like toxin [Mycobacterium phage Benvolio]
MPSKPKPWPDNLLQKSDKRLDTDQRRADNIAAVNPRWNERTPDDPNTDRQWNINCTRCAATVEMRARGYDVTALPKPENLNDNYTHMSSAKWIDEHGNPAQWDYLDGSRDRIMDEINARAALWPEGARGLIRTTWEGGGGHIFNWEKRDGVIRFIDGQPNQWDASSSWTNQASEWGHNTAVVRVDHLNPHEDLSKWVRNRTPEEINAPLRREVTVEMQRRGYKLGEPIRQVFLEGWDDIRSGRGYDPTKYANDPEFKAIYEAAVKWARRPI